MAASVFVVSADDCPGRWFMALGHERAIPRYSLCAALPGAVPGPETAVSVLVTLVLLVSGIYYFRRMERTFRETIGVLSVSTSSA